MVADAALGELHHQRANGPDGDERPAGEIFVQELHEVRGSTAAWSSCATSASRRDLVPPLPRVAGREPPLRFLLENGEQRGCSRTCATWSAEIRKLGEHGLTITRFKGLGEMDAEELWETTLDPPKRTLLQGAARRTP